MPVVGLYGGRKVSTDPIPGVRKTAAETDTSEGVGLEIAKGNRAENLARLGGGIARTGEQLGAVAMDVIHKERQRADETALLEASNVLDSWENRALYDPNDGALTVKGKDAMPLPETVGGKYQEVVGQVAQTLGTDRQRQAFSKLSIQRAERLDLTLRRHVFQEMQAYEGNELQKHIENQVNTAIANATDPSRVAQALGDAVSAIKTHAPRLGLGPDGLQATIENVTTRTHVGVIESLLAQDQTRSAQIYFEEAKGEISGKALVEVQKALAVGTTRAAAQKASDAILNAGGTLAEQRAKARAITDPEVRDSVMQRLEHEDAVNDKITREDETSRLTAAYASVDKFATVDRIAPADQAKLAQHMPALRAYALHRAKGEPIETDLPTYYAALQQSASDPQTFAKQNLLAYKAKLGETEFKHLAEIQRAILADDRKSIDTLLGGFRTHTEIVDNSLTAYGINPKAKPDTPEGQSIAQLYRMLDTRVESLQTASGKKATNEQIQQTLDQILSTSVDTKGSWWDIWPGGKPGPFTSTTKPVIGLTLEDIPADMKKLIEAGLREKHKPVSDATILNVWIEHQARTRRP